MNRTAFDEVSFLWAEHQGLAFLDALRGVEIHGEPVAFLDASLAGNVSAYLAGRTDPWLLVGLDDRLQGPSGSAARASRVRGTRLRPPPDTDGRVDSQRSEDGTDLTEDRHQQ